METSRYEIKFGVEKEERLDIAGRQLQATWPNGAEMSLEGGLRGL